MSPLQKVLNRIKPYRTSLPLSKVLPVKVSATLIISSVMIVCVITVSELEVSGPLFKTMVNGACVCEKKHVVKGPKRGYISILLGSTSWGEGPRITSKIGVKNWVIGDVRNVNVSKIKNYTLRTSLIYS